MTYLEALEFIHSRPRFAATPTLERIKRITSYCGNPQRGMRFIHIAGTNGKGSVSVMLGSMLRCVGHRVGVFTSPYIIDFRDRFCINGEIVSEQAIIDAVEQIKPIIEKMDSEGEFANEFEINTAVGFLLFRAAKCDYVVLEVGLGGRFDATNVIDAPEVAVIAHIDLDHTEILGDTVAKVAAEKCGIIKNGCKVVSYPEQYQDAMQVIRDSCAKCGCELLVPEIPYGKASLNGNSFTYCGEEYRTEHLIGVHQIKNAVTALCALQALGVDISMPSVKLGLKCATIAGRQEVLHSNPTVMLDGAHNPDGLSALAKTLSCLDSKPNAVIGMLADKDVERSVSVIAPYFEHVYTASVNSPRSLSAEALAEIVGKYCDSVEVLQSLDSALSESKNGLVICGSLYLVSEIRPKLLEKLK